MWQHKQAPGLSKAQMRINSPSSQRSRPTTAAPMQRYSRGTAPTPPTFMGFRLTARTRRASFLAVLYSLEWRSWAMRSLRVEAKAEERTSLTAGQGRGEERKAEQGRKSRGEGRGRQWTSESSGAGAGARVGWGEQADPEPSHTAPPVQSNPSQPRAGQHPTGSSAAPPAAAPAAAAHAPAAA